MSVLVAIGGGELRQKTTAAIDAYVARLAAERAASERGYALFVGTASHDSLPYFNTFRKTYTSDYNLKADVAVITKDMMSYEKISGKFQKADMIYVGGGDTLFMLDKWRETGVDKLILDAYRRGVIICGLSAGAICWFEKMYSDSVKEGRTGGYRGTCHAALQPQGKGLLRRYDQRRIYLGLRHRGQRRPGVQ